jgi:hypothetical protein
MLFFYNGLADFPAVQLAEQLEGVIKKRRVPISALLCAGSMFFFFPASWPAALPGKPSFAWNCLT